MTFWDDKRTRDLRVIVAIDDSTGMGVFDYLRDSFIMAPDGSFIDE